MTRQKTSSAQKRRTTLAQVQAAEARRRRLIIGLGVVGVIAAAGVLAIVLALAPPPISEPAAEPVVVSGTPLPELPASGVDPAVGMILPSLTGIGLDGRSLTIAPDGRAKAIVIFAHWCPHCQAEMPRLVEWLAANHLPAGVDLVGLSTAISDTRPNYPPSTWLSSIGWRQPTLIDDATYTAYVALGGSSYPGFVFVNADGTVEERDVGEIDVATFAAHLAQIAP